MEVISIVNGDYISIYKWWGTTLYVVAETKHHFLKFDMQRLDLHILKHTRWFAVRYTQASIIPRIGVYGIGLCGCVYSYCGILLKIRTGDDDYYVCDDPPVGW